MKKKIFMGILAFALVLCTTFAFVGCNSNGNQTPPTTNTVEYYMVSASAATGGKVYGGGHAIEGDNVTLYAEPNDGYRFDRWSDGNTNPERKFNNVNEDISLTAYFKPVLRFAKAQIAVYHTKSVPSAKVWMFKNFSVKYNDQIIAETGTYHLASLFAFDDASGNDWGFPAIYANGNYEFDKNSTITLEVDFDLRLSDGDQLIDICYAPDTIQLEVKEMYETIRFNGERPYYECKISSDDGVFDAYLTIYFE